MAAPARRRRLTQPIAGSIILGSVAYYFDRYGYEVLPIAMQMLQDEQVPAQTLTNHVLISAKNVFREYPPYDMN